MSEVQSRAVEDNVFVSKFESFFSQVCRKQIHRLAEQYPDKRSLELDFKELEKFDFELADELLEKPDLLLEAAQLAVESLSVPSLQEEVFQPYVRFFNLPQDRQPLLRDIGAVHLEKMISVEGVIKQITSVLPKLKTAAWKCKFCGNKFKIAQTGTEIKQPNFCDCRHRDFQLVPEESEFINYQKITLQDPLEALKGNEQPTDLDVFLIDDLVNRVTAGDRLRVTGILRLNPARKGLVFGRFLETLHLEETEREFEEVEISPEEEKEVQKLAKDPEIYEKLVQSLAPMIYGHEVVKEAIVLKLFGGVKKALPNNQKIRGNIHILLVGDPAVGKTQLMLATNNIAPKSIFVGGKTTSGVGLAASAVKDDFGEGGWTLKAGALVLASGGLCSIDELDKMDSEDRSALHEAMESGTISVAKAGIIARFKSDTSVLAASNPKYSRFDLYQPFLEQVELPASLISRFDLFFMIKDVLDRTKDQEIASHILRTHQSGEKLLQQNKTGIELDKKDLKEIKKLVTPVIDGLLLKKYISYARQNIFPTLSKESMQSISDFYVQLREKGKQEGHFAATHRQLEGLIRLSEASARVRLSDTVDIEDAQRAIRLFMTSLEETVKDPETGKIDIDVVTSGQTQSQRDQLKLLLQLIKDKAQGTDAGVPVESLLMDVETLGMDKDKVRDLLKTLEKKGDIYRPRYNLIKPTQFHD